MFPDEPHDPSSVTTRAALELGLAVLVTLLLLALAQLVLPA